MRSQAIILVGAVAGSLFAASCAIVGYDLGGYRPANGGASNGGASNSGSGGNGGGTSSTGAGAGCMAGQTCSEAPPQGWQGPVALLENQTSPACAGAYPDLLFAGGSSPKGAPATCSGCTCDTTPCNAITFVTAYTDGACTTGAAAYALGTTCGSVGPTGAAHVMVTGPTTSGSCTPSTVVVQTTPPAFGTTVIACGGANVGKTCGPSESCAPAPKAPFEPGLCIFRAGNVQCPAGLTKHVFFDDLDDTRGCTACACGAAAANCPATVTLASDTACALAVGTVASGSGCTALAGAWNSGISKVSSPCTPLQGQPQGGVSGVGPTTFCCE